MKAAKNQPDTWFKTYYVFKIYKILMSILVKVLYAILLIVAISCRYQEESSSEIQATIQSVSQLGTSNWDSGFLQSKQAYFIYFYTNDEWGSQYAEAASRVKAIPKYKKVVFVEVDINQNPTLENVNSITRFPTLRFYKAGSKNVNKYSQRPDKRSRKPLVSIYDWSVTLLASTITRLQAEL